MGHVHVPSEIPVKFFRKSAKHQILIVATFLAGLFGSGWSWVTDPDRFWQAYISNWMFFTNIAVGAVLFAVVTWITKAKWNWSVRRVSLSFVGFLPISFVLFLPMLGLGDSYFPWISEMAHDPILQKKAAYLNMPFLLARNVLGLLVLFGTAIYFAYLALRPDMGLCKDGTKEEMNNNWRTRLMKGWRGQDNEEMDSYRRMVRVGPAFVILYFFVMSIISYDWVMSLDPHWFSTMMGPWFFMGAFWSGIAATACVVTFLKKQENYFDEAMGVQQLHDIGKLTFGFCVFWAYLVFAQYLVIWYGKLPWEQAWIIRRSEEPWGKLSLIVVLMCFVTPFVGLIGRKPKMTPWFLRLVALIALGGLWLEKHLMVAPSVRHPETTTLGATEFLVGVMFLGIFLYSLRWFLSTFPVIQLWQPGADPEAVDMEKLDCERGQVAQAGT